MKTNIKFLVFLYFLNFYLFSQDVPLEDSPEVIQQKKIAYLQEQARTYLQWNEIDQAEKYLNQAIELAPENENSLLIKSAILIRRENFLEAVEYAAKGFKDSKHRQILYLIDKCNDIEPASIKIREQSLLWVKEAKELSSKSNKWNASIYAKAYLKNNDFKNAIETIQPLLLKTPDHFELNVILANIYTKQGDYLLGMKTLQKVIFREPKLANCQNHIAYQLLTYDDENLNQPIIALSYALLASDGSEQKIEDIEDTLALAYFKTGDTKSACDAQKRAIENFKSVLPPNQINRSSKLKGFQRQLKYYEKFLDTKK